MRGNPEQRNHFARSLPQAILSELVIVMSGLPATPGFTPRPVKHALPAEAIDAESRPTGANKRQRKSAGDLLINTPDTDFDVKPVIKKPARKSEPNRRPINKGRISTALYHYISAEDDPDWTAEKELDYCRGLIDRMMSGPGFWTRLVGPFKTPVNPEIRKYPRLLHRRQESRWTSLQSATRSETMIT